MTAEWIAGNIAAHWIQAAVLATSALVAMRLFVLNEPPAKLAALHLTLVAIFLLPAVQPWRPDAPALQLTATSGAIDVHTITTETMAATAFAAGPSFDPLFAALILTAAGIAFRLIWLFYGVVRLALFSRAASTVATPEVAQPLEVELGVSPRYIQQAGSRGPWTFGFFRPTVALPAGFDALVPAFQQSVICHELVHVKRRDMAVAFFEELAVAALWFHPCIWMLRSRIRVAREQVVDRQVVALLGNRDEYVRCLVDISGHDLAPHFSQAGAGMLRPRELRARVDAIFQEAHMSRARVAVAALAFVVVVMATGLIGAAAMPLRAAVMVPAAPSEVAPLVLAAGTLPTLVTHDTKFFRVMIERGDGSPASARQQIAPEASRKQINTVYPEYPHDALERGIRGTVIVDITVNAAGDVTTAAVVNGPQELRASAFKAALGLKYTKGQSAVAIKVAFEYMLTASSWGVKINGALPNIGLRFPVTPGGNSYVEKAPASPDASGAYRVGGNLRPPKKLKDVPTEYPALAQQARVQGVVILEVLIDESGNVSDTRVLRSIPLLDQAAIDAVKQWQYEPTLLNGAAVPLIMTVTVNFTLRPLARIQVTMPDGSAFTELRADVPTQFVADFGRFHFVPSRAEGSPDLKVSVFGEDGQTHLGDVVLVPDGPVVQSPSSPSFGMRLVFVR